MGVGARVTVGVQRGFPLLLGQFPDRGTHPGVQGEPERVVHLVAAAFIERGQVLHDGVGGAGPVDGDQQPAPVPGGDLGDRLGDDVDVIGGGV